MELRPPRLGRRLTIGLINNMPDAALRQAERQFRRLAGEHDITWRRYSLPGIARARAVAAFIETNYDEFRDIGTHNLDALIITGAEPVAQDLRQEPFWPALACLLDWSERHGLPLLLSCLAAHAAVLHRDGIERRRLAAKCSGVFTYESDAHALLDGLPPSITTPHSRWHEVPASALRDAGYEILAASDAHGVDLFARNGAAPWFCWQGHPEYEGDTLMLELRRDLRRFLRGESTTLPTAPACLPGSEEIEAVLARAREQPSETLLALLPRIEADTAPWRPMAGALFGNWLRYVRGQGQLVGIETEESKKAVLF